MPRAKPDRSALMMSGLNLIQQAISIFDSDLRLVVANRRMLEMFDLPDRFARDGVSFAEVIRYLAERGEYGEIEDIDDFVADRVKLAQAFEPHYMERTRANGRVISVEGAPLQQGGWVTVYTDITNTRRHEALLQARSEELSDQLSSYAAELSSTNRALESTIAQLEEAKRELTEIEARTRLTTEMMPAHIAHVDLDRRYTYSNRRLSSVMPGRPSDILGRHIAETLGAQAYTRIEPHLSAAFAGDPSVFEFTDALSSRRIRVAFTPDTDSDGGIDGVYILSMDVTEETQARVALQQTRKRELAAQLTSGLAHDFSNLLTIILGMQGKLQKMDLPEEAGALVSATLSAARRGGTLLHRIADMTGRRQLKLQATDLDLFLRDMETLAGPSLPDGIGIDMRNDAGPGPWMIDPGTVQDALLNLVLNARDAIGPSTQGRIGITARRVQDTWLEFSVSDTGPGFSDEALDHALDPFFTTKGGEGSGLGLSMVYDTVKLAGGEVHLGNGLTGGRVVIRLPLRPARDLPQAAGLVLVVEDSPDLRETIRQSLTGAGQAVAEAASVDEALAIAEGVEGIGLILSDLSLKGGQTGVDLFHRLGPARPPVVFMTSLPPSDPLRQAAAALAPVLAKPVGAEDIAAVLTPHPAGAAQ
ncbi:PAS-domain containing protein [Marivivens marinus]|uniref:PAS-domain containing protein n=1 Tax=Marivivens marinus TaxID=3110173 RepID=UPI003B84713C